MFHLFVSFSFFFSFIFPLSLIGGIHIRKKQEDKRKNLFICLFLASSVFSSSFLFLCLCFLGATALGCSMTPPVEKHPPRKHAEPRRGESPWLHPVSGATHPWRFSRRSRFPLAASLNRTLISHVVSGGSSHMTVVVCLSWRFRCRATDQLKKARDRDFRDRDF